MAQPHLAPQRWVLCGVVSRPVPAPISQAGYPATSHRRGRDRAQNNINKKCGSLWCPALVDAAPEASTSASSTCC